MNKNNIQIQGSIMKSFTNFLLEEDEGAKLKHIHHAEDRPLFHGSEGFEHAHGALQQAHDAVKAGEHSTALTMKYDGSPAVVFGHHPQTGKFFVASKSAFNKNPKINYTEKDIDDNHGHAPGLATKLKAALKHLPKVAPKSGVYQGDIMHTPDDHKKNKDGSVSFTPNTITYTAKGEEADKVKKSKVGIAVHTKYEGKDLHTMHATPNARQEDFESHPDVHLKSAEHDTTQVHYTKDQEAEFKKHMDAAKEIHKKEGKKMYAGTLKHQGEAGHLSTYINHTVRTDETPTAEGFMKHLKNVHQKLADKVKTEKSKNEKLSAGAEHASHVKKNKEHYDNLFKMHQHLQKAKNTLTSALETHEGGLEHHIEGKKSKPEGFVVNHKGEPTKLVNRAEFAKANLLKVRK
jgi:hypothetical protein